MKKYVLFTILVIAGIYAGADAYASCRASFHGNYSDENLQLKIRTTSSSGKTSRGAYSNKRMAITLTLKNSNVRKVKIIYGNVVFKLKENNTVSIRLHQLKRRYKLKIHYIVPNKKKNVPRWKKIIRVKKEITILQDRLRRCHQRGRLKII